MRKYLFIFMILSLVFCSGKNVSNDKINLSGVISLNKDKTADVPSPVEGKVVSLSVDLGDKVKKGQTLLLLYSREFSQTKADFFRSLTNLNITRKEFERARFLFEKKDIEEGEFLRTKDEYTKVIKRYDDSKSGLLSLGLMESQIEMLIKKHEAFMKNLHLSDLDEPYLSI
ncbi:MAG: efflux RND transporter periplasmic adaptor subunit, partial [Patescibacteria group bacterium]